MMHLTKRRLWAIENALHHSLAGVIEGSRPNRWDYEQALKWVKEEQERRSKPENSHERT